MLLVDSPALQAIVTQTSHFIDELAGPAKPFDLIQRLNQQGLFDFFAGDEPMLALYKKNFLAMHALYTVQDRLLSRGISLAISPISLTVTPLADCEGSALTAEATALGEFYLDLNYFNDATSETAHKLLESFWQKYHAHDHLTEAFAVLELEPTQVFAEVKAQYRRLANIHHPDKGGDEEQFRRMQEAYGVIKRAL